MPGVKPLEAESSELQMVLEALPPFDFLQAVGECVSEGSAELVEEIPVEMFSRVASALSQMDPSGHVEEDPTSVLSWPVDEALLEAFFHSTENFVLPQVGDDLLAVTSSRAAGEFLSVHHFLPAGLSLVVQP